MIHSMVEVDITEARKNLRELKKKEYASITGYIIHCVSRAVEENKRVHAYRNFRNQLIEFDDVDVSTTMERKIDGRNEVVAMIIRSANKKSVQAISREIEEERKNRVNDAEVYKFIRFYLAIPVFLRTWIFRIMDRSPHVMKKKSGTIMVTSVVLPGGEGGWGIPVASHTLNITIGSVVTRLKEIKGSIEKREHLCLTVSFDHDIVDGAPAARFVRSMTRLIKSGPSLV